MPFLDAVPLFGEWRIHRDEQRFRTWQDLLATQQHGAQIFRIVRIRQRARTGLKASGEWLKGGEKNEVWFSSAWPRLGTYVSAEGSFSNGPHHHGSVFYARSPWYFFDLKAQAAVQRHLARKKEIVNSPPSMPSSDP